MLQNSYKKEKEAKECEVCKRLRIGLTWVGDPPKCIKHRKKDSYHKYWS